MLNKNKNYHVAKPHKINDRLLKRNIFIKKQINKKNYGINIQHVIEKMPNGVQISKHKLDI